MTYNIYYILGAVLVVYLLISIANKKTARKRRSRKFMEGYERRGNRSSTGRQESKKKSQDEQSPEDKS